MKTAGIKAFLNPFSRSATPAIAGLRVIVIAIVNYVFMLATNFGIPHFTFGTPKGRAEIGYALSTLCLIVIGGIVIYRDFTKPITKRTD